ncbi:MAG: YraN family protein [Chloroflexi bacterium]|nr:YraN family protein [Chloroflexota bacterium]
MKLEIGLRVQPPTSNLQRPISMKTTRARKNLGESGERVAALFLEQRGYKIIARNFRTRTGEMDLIAQDADGLAFIEVRARRAGASMTPEESIATPRKRTRLFAVAQEFLSAQPEFADAAWRIDLVAIELDRAGRVVRMEVVKNAVEG